MAKPELGLKRQCVACGARFYDLMRAPAVCPKCGTEQPAEQPRLRRAGGVPEPKVRKPVPVPEAAVEEAEVEGVEESEDEEVLEDTSDLEDGDADLAGDIAVDEPGEDEER